MISMNLVAYRHALYRPKIWLGGILALFVNTSPTAAQTLQNQLEQALHFLKQGAVQSAHQQFTQMEVDYGISEAYQDPKLQAQLRPIRAHTAYFSQDYSVATQLYHNWIQAEKKDPQVTMLAQFQLARCYQALQQSEKANQHYAIVYTHTVDPNEAAIAQLYQAKLLCVLKRYDEAYALLKRALQLPLKTAIRNDIKVYALKIAHLLGNLQYVHSLINEVDWQESMQHNPIDFNRTLMTIANEFYDRADYTRALEYYRSIPPRKSLQRKMSQAIANFRQQIKQTSHVGYSIHSMYAQERIEALTAAHQSLTNSADNRAALYLKMGQCWLLKGRYQEAVILFSQLSASDSFSKEIRTQAQYRWVLALIESKQWHQAQLCAQDFMRTYPAHPLLPELRYLIAQSLERQKKFRNATELLDSLIEDYPHHTHQQRWQFSCGYGYTRLESFEAARRYYQQALTIDPQSRLSIKIKLWQALSYYFEGDHLTSQMALEQLQTESPSTPFYPEILFRLANVYYAQKAYTKSQKILIELCDHYSEHPRNPQALALLGDIYGIGGELEAALACYARIRPQQGSSFEYAVFQAVKIYRLTDQKVAMRRQLENYLALPDAAMRPRISEALYWLGWSYAATAEYTKAVQHFEHALDRYDDDPQAQSIDAILSAYQRLYPQVIQNNPQAPKDFSRWLEIRTQAALKNQRLTRYAHLQNFCVQKKQDTTENSTVDARLLLIHQKVPIERQPPITLGSVGLCLAKRGYRSAQKYFNYLLNHYPESPDRGAAYYGQAILANTLNEDPHRALSQLKLFFRETPLHPYLAQAHLLEAELRIQIKDFELARDQLKKYLADKRFRGRNHALALEQCALLETQARQPERAIAYWQRIYTLYRAYPDLVAEAYWQSHLQFRELQDYPAAEASLMEMQSDHRLEKYWQTPEFSQALERVQRARKNAQMQKQESEGLVL